MLINRFTSERCFKVSFIDLLCSVSITSQIMDHGADLSSDLDRFNLLIIKLWKKQIYYKINNYRLILCIHFLLNNPTLTLQGCVVIDTVLVTWLAQLHNTFSRLWVWVQRHFHIKNTTFSSLEGVRRKDYPLCFPRKAFVAVLYKDLL